MPGETRVRAEAEAWRGTTTEAPEGTKIGTQSSLTGRMKNEIPGAETEKAEAIRQDGIKRPGIPEPA
jgi:hypothetical protein